MAIPQSFIEQLKLSCDIESIMSSYVTFKRAGRNKTCVCPFHSEKTASMVVYEDTQSFYCFGCGAGGDVITFIRRIENLDYVEAIRFLASRVGLTVPDGAIDDRAARLKTRVLELNKETARFFHACLKSEAGREGYAYLRNRELSDKTITSYGLGFAPNSWDSLLKHLTTKGFSTEEMEAAAVIVKGRKGSYYDQFRNRVMFPIIDLRGNVIAFGGRVLDDSKPKYLNSSDTPVFKKSRNLFSLNFAKNEAKDRLILAEGYMDVISIHQAGFHNVVATLGTALTAEQARLIAQYTGEVVIAYDSDGPGQTATHRAVNIFDEVGIRAKVLHISGAKDPDEFIKKFGATRFKLLIEGADSVIDFELQKARGDYDTTTEEGKIGYLKKAVGVISEIRNTLEREVYAGKLADELNVSREAILAQAKAVAQKRYKTQKKQEWQGIESNKKAYQDRLNPQRASHLKEALAEEGILAFLLKNPDYLEFICERLSPDEFVTDFNKRIFSLVLSKLTGNTAPAGGAAFDLTILSADLTNEEMGRVAGIMAKSHEFPNTDRQLEDYIGVLKAYHAKKAPDDIAKMSPEEVAAYAARLREKKGLPDE